MRVGVGELSGRVQGSKATPRLVELSVPVIPAGEWAQIVEIVADQARYSARLVAELAPEGLDAELATRGIELFPQARDVEVTCACSDPSTWCVHALAVWEAAAAQIDDDPFFLLRVRGRGRERLLAELAASRSRSSRDKGDPLAVAIADLDAERWGRGQQALDALLLDRPADAGPAPVLAALGDPPGWEGGVSAVDLFGPMIRRAAEWAAEIDRQPGEPVLGADG
ncbi:MAG TPA: hypothetical protein VML96_09655 [Egibacteraceae bacterium]|nr:hypothetical protein [Egibacteraceae bacterium]